MGSLAASRSGRSRAHEEAGRCRCCAARRLFIANRRSAAGAALTNSGAGHRRGDHNHRGANHHAADHHPTDQAGSWEVLRGDEGGGVVLREGTCLLRGPRAAGTHGRRWRWHPLRDGVRRSRRTRTGANPGRRVATRLTRMTACRRLHLTLTAPMLATESRLTTATAIRTAWTPMATGLAATATASRSELAVPRRNWGSTRPPKVPFKLMTAGATSGPHPGHNRRDRSGQPRSPRATICPSQPRYFPPAAGRHDPSPLSDTKRAQVQPCRAHHPSCWLNRS